MKFYLLLRVRVLGRQLAELGWWRMLLLGPLLVVVLGKALVVVSLPNAGQWLVPPVVVLLVISQHRQRPDLDFLRLTAPRFRLWLAAEYVLWSAPAALALFGFGRVGGGLLTLAVAPLGAWVPAAHFRTARPGRSLFRSEAFEWVSGFRQSGAGWLWGALVLAACWWRQYTIVPAGALGTWVLLLTALYATPEPWTMLPTARPAAAGCLAAAARGAGPVILCTNGRAVCLADGNGRAKLDRGRGAAAVGRSRADDGGAGPVRVLPERPAGAAHASSRSGHGLPAVRAPNLPGVAAGGVFRVDLEKPAAALHFSP